MGDESQDPSEPSQRDFGRLKLGIPAQLETLDGRKQVRLVDLSQGGAQVVLNSPVDIRECMLIWLGFESFCTVVWNSGDRLGLKFERPLRLATIVETRNLAPSVAITDDVIEAEAARAWVEGLNG